MEKVKSILARCLLFVIAFQVLNQSIDFDYITFSNAATASQGFDDVDSMMEYIVEKVVGNDLYTSENDDDSGRPISGGIEKVCLNPLYYESAKDIIIHSPLSALQAVNPVIRNEGSCNGFLRIISPPPKEKLIV